MHALAADYEIVALTRQGTSASAKTVVQVDLQDPGAAPGLRTALAGGPLTAVLHLAAATPRLGGDDLGEMLAVNAVGTQRLLAGLPAPPGRVGCFSTVDVFGRPAGEEELDERSPVDPATHYALSKYAGEQAARIWCRHQGVPLLTLRLSQVYGPGDPTPKVIPSFCRQAAAGRAPTVRGTGEEVRQPLHVDDVVGAVRAWLARPWLTPTDTVILAGPERTSVRDLARLVMRCAGLAGEPETLPGPAGPPVHYRFRLSHAQDVLGWSPRVGLAEGIESVLRSLHQA